MKVSLFLSSIVALSISGAWATPARTAGPSPPQKTHDVEIVHETANYTRFDLCDMAPNCETFDDPKYGKLIRFKKGMEPGTASYNRTLKEWGNRPTKVMARAPVGSVLAVIGENRILYGTVDPRDVMAGLWDACQWGACSTSIRWYNTQSVRDLRQNGYYGTKPDWYSMILHPFNSRYGDWDQRNKMVSAIITMATQGLLRWNSNYAYARYNPISGRYEFEDSGKISVTESGDYYSVTMFTRPAGPILGLIDVSVTSDYQTPTAADCGLLRGIKSALYSSLNPLFGIAVTISNYGSCK
ncbi:hypothetical protein TWF696_009738 [Orbilia brochopaga]|uniref:Uncharacterized protein n=1 Tax=Orbilia brochopaga TaxID=3140254 RepID=A0AAV9UBE8_9PEZI